MGESDRITINIINIFAMNTTTQWQSVAHLGDLWSHETPHGEVVNSFRVTPSTRFFTTPLQRRRPLHDPQRVSHHRSPPAIRFQQGSPGEIFVLAAIGSQHLILLAHFKMVWMMWMWINMCRNVNWFRETAQIYPCLPGSCGSIGM